MKLMNQVRSYGARVMAPLAGFAALSFGTLARAADESGITTTDALAVIADGKAKGIVLALAVLGLIIAFKIVKKVSSAV